MANQTESSSTPSVYEQIGPEAFEKLVQAFYRRVTTDPVLRPMYPDEDLELAGRRLRLFLVERFGGPPAYRAERGHPRLRWRHSPFRIDQTARDRWVRHMLAALHEARIPEPACMVLRTYFEHTATAMINRYMPDLPE